MRQNGNGKKLCPIVVISGFSSSDNIIVYNHSVNKIAITYIDSGKSLSDRNKIGAPAVKQVRQNSFF